MAVIVNITGWTVGTTDEDLNVSNSGWTKNTSTGAYGTTGAILVTDANAPPNTAYPNVSTGPGYLRDETPGSTTQTVKLTLRRVGTVGSAQIWYVIARATSGGDDYLAAAYQADTSRVSLVKCINGTRTTILAATTVSGLISTGDEKVLEIRVSGVSPTISVSAYWDGTQVGTTQTVTDSQVDGVGLVGMSHRNALPTSSTAGIHATKFYAEDDTSSDTTPPTLSSPTGTATGSTTATVGATTDEGNGTMYAFVSTSATPPSATDLKVGTGAVWSGSQTISSIGAKTFNATGLTASTSYYAHLIHTDAASNDSSIVTSAQFTTNAPGVFPPVLMRAFPRAILNH